MKREREMKGLWGNDKEYGSGDYIEVNSLIVELKLMAKAGATHVQFSGSSDSDGCVEEVTICPYRHETDEEFNKRIEEENKLHDRYAQQRKEAELKELARLKEKYDS